jgi:hypothetical protein
MAKMRSRQREFEPDPVPAVHSVGEDAAMERKSQNATRHGCWRELPCTRRNRVQPDLPQSSSSLGKFLCALNRLSLSQCKMVVNYHIAHSARWE